MDDQLREQINDTSHWKMSTRFVEHHEKNFLYPILEWLFFDQKQTLIAQVVLSSIAVEFTFQNYTDIDEVAYHYSAVEEIIQHIHSDGFPDPPAIDTAYSLLNQWYLDIEKEAEKNPGGIGSDAMDDRCRALDRKWKQIIGDGTKFQRDGLPVENLENVWITSVIRLNYHDLRYPVFEWKLLRNEKVVYHLQLISWNKIFAITDSDEKLGTYATSADDILALIELYDLPEPPFINALFECLLEAASAWPEDMRTEGPEGHSVTQTAMNDLYTRWVAIKNRPRVEAARKFWNELLLEIDFKDS